MKTDWLVLDVSYLAYRSFYALRGQLSHKGVSTTVTYGVFREIVQLMEHHNTSNIVFCFDKGQSLRRKLYRGYKQKRRDNAKQDDALAEARKVVAQELNALHTRYLPDAGFRNVVGERGYEADDLIARTVEHAGRGRRMIIVGSDHDLYQLLGRYVCIWNPHTKTRMTEKKFRKEWNISPSQWVDVKAIAGCSSDNIPGVKGVGEKTAVSYLAGSLQSGKKFDDITTNSETWQRNYELVRLPFEGTPKVELCDDDVTQASWLSVMRSLNIRIPWSVAAFGS